LEVFDLHGYIVIENYHNLVSDQTVNQIKLKSTQYFITYIPLESSQSPRF